MAETTASPDRQGDAAFESSSRCTVRKNWGWLAVRGLLAVSLGVAAILFPANALFAFTLVFAAFAFVDGVASLIAGARGTKNKQDRWWALILRGIVGIAVGLIFVLNPALSTFSYALVTLAIVSAWSIVVGIMEISAAVRLRKEIEGEWLLGLSGLVSVLLGIAIPVLLFFNPAATILSVAWIIGGFALMAGVILMLQAIRLRRRDAEAEPDRTGPSSAV